MKGKLNWNSIFKKNIHFDIPNISESGEILLKLQNILAELMPSLESLPMSLFLDMLTDLMHIASIYFSSAHKQIVQTIDSIKGSGETITHMEGKRPSHPKLNGSLEDKGVETRSINLAGVNGSDSYKIYKKNPEVLVSELSDIFTILLEYTITWTQLINEEKPLALINSAKNLRKALSQRLEGNLPSKTAKQAQSLKKQHVGILSLKRQLQRAKSSKRTRR